MLTGKTNEEKIWNYLIEAGMTAYGAAGLMGNLYAESGLNPTNLQNSTEKKLGYTDDTYTAAVDSRAYTNFAKDGAGYGLAQWTHRTRKAALLAFARVAERSVGDLEMQLTFLMDELIGSYAAVLYTLQNAKTIEGASNAVLLKFERPADQSVQNCERRAKMGQRYYEKFAAGQAAEGGKMNKKPVSYLQTDTRWKNKPYKVKGESATIGSAGCGPTAAAMLLSTLTGKNITPEDACKWSVDHGYKALGNGTYYSYFAPQFAAYGIKCWQLNWVNAYHNAKATSFDETVKYLKQGYLSVGQLLRWPEHLRFGDSYIIGFDNFGSPVKHSTFQPPPLKPRPRSILFQMFRHGLVCCYLYEIFFWVCHFLLSPPLRSYSVTYSFE